MKGVLLSYQIDGNRLKLVLQAKEKIMVQYTFSTEQEKLDFKNQYRLGYQIEVNGILKQPSSNRNFHLFHYQNYLKSKQIFWIMDATFIDLVGKNLSFFYQWKDKIYKQIKKKKNGLYFKYLLLGDSSEVDSDFKESAQVLGISHLFAISGMHIHLLVGMLLWIMKKGIHKEWMQGILLFLFLSFYSFLTNFSPSVVRASSFFILLWMKKLWKWKVSSFFLLFLIWILMLIYNPYYCFHLGFQFSFLISFSLLYFSRFQQKQSYLKQIFQTSWISFWMGVPIMIRNFFQVNFLTPIWNLFFVPFVSLLLFPICVICLFCPYLYFLMDGLLFILNTTMEFANQFSCFTFSFAYISLPVFFCYYIIIVFVLASFLKKRYKPFLFFIGILCLHYHIAFFNPHFILTMIDVGQGDSTLMRFPYNQGNILVDTGGLISYQEKPWQRRKSNYSIGKSTLIPYLRSVGIHCLDYLILTHGDYDHIGEAETLLDQFCVKQIVMNSGNLNQNEEKIYSKAKEKQIPVFFLSNGKIEIGKNTLYFLNTQNRTNENEDSLIVYTRVYQSNILLMGDAGEEAEKKLLETTCLPKIDILKVGHHGSKGSTSSQFLNQIRPKYALISAGVNNRFSHPHFETLNRLKDSIIYTTHIHGMIEFKIYRDVQIKTRYVAR